MERTATDRGTAVAEQLGAALRFAREAHEGQRRKQNDRPYIEHPIAVQELLAERGFDGKMRVAAYLHDTVEKTDTELDEIERRFGPDVARIVDALSEDSSLTRYEERKRALRRQALDSGRDSAILYAADRLANLRDWRGLSPEERRRAAERLGTTYEARLRLWGEDLEELHELDGGLPFLEEVEVELRALRADSKA